LGVILDEVLLLLVYRRMLVKQPTLEAHEGPGLRAKRRAKIQGVIVVVVVVVVVEFSPFSVLLVRVGLVVARACLCHRRKCFDYVWTA
jgi:hypothetical protein